MQDKQIEDKLKGLKHSVKPDQALLTRILEELPNASVTAAASARSYTQEVPIGPDTSSMWFRFKNSFSVPMLAPVMIAIAFAIGLLITPALVDPDLEVLAMELESMEIESTELEEDMLDLEGELTLDLLEIDLLL